MLNRDFKKSNFEYIKQNKIHLIILSLILIVGLVCGIAFGFRGNFEIAGCQEFSISISKENRNNINQFAEKTERILNRYGANYDTYSVFGEGDNTKIIVRYLNNLSVENAEKVNSEIASELNIEITQISTHSSVAPIVKSSDYVYTAMTILLIWVVATIFNLFRYNAASAFANLIACAIGTLTFLSATTILRLTVGMSYFAILVMINAFITYLSFAIFERIREESWLANKDYQSAISSAMNKSKFRIGFVCISILAVGVGFVLFAPNSVRMVSLSIMFMAVSVMFASLYVVPFVWNMIIPNCKKRNLVKTNSKNN